MLNLLLVLLFARGLKKHKINSRILKTKFKKESKYWILLGKDLLTLTRKTFNFISKKLKPVISKKVCQSTVVPIKNVKVIDFTEYKLKKAK